MKMFKMRIDPVSILSQLGLAWTDLCNGFVGAAIWAVHRKTKFWAAVRQMFIGGIVAGYSTPFLSKELSVKETGFLSFIVGTVGLVILENAYQWIAKKIKLLFT
jgi:hypothetical protein